MERIQKLARQRSGQSGDSRPNADTPFVALLTDGTMVYVRNVELRPAINGEVAVVLDTRETV